MRSATVYRRWRAFGLAFAFLALSSCGGSGGGGSSSPPPTPPSKVFFTDAGNGAIVSFTNATPTASFPIERVVAGPHTLLPPGGGVLSIPSITLDAANNRLYVATQGNTFIYNNISTATGDVAPNVIMSALINTGGPALQGVNFWYNALDQTRSGMLYSVDFNGEVHVFNNPLTAPSTVNRVIKPDLGAATASSPFGLAIDAARDMLYVGVFFGPSGSNIIVFNTASTIGTTLPTTFPPPPTTITPVAPDRTLTFTPAVVSFHLDTTHDRLYTSHTDGIVRVFDNAHALLTGTPTPDRTIDLGGGVPINSYIFVDTGRDKLYAVASAGTTGALGIIDNASTANEPNTPGHFFTFSNVPNIALSAIAVAP
jgi:hypothetical protein